MITTGCEWYLRRKNSIEVTKELEKEAERKAKYEANVRERIEKALRVMGMVKVEGGTFLMGATPEQEDIDDYWNLEESKPVHWVTLSNNYYMGKTVVTQDLWEAVMEPYNNDKEGVKLPKNSVSLNGCKYFIQKLNAMTGKKFRLPTEAEWEFAARGGNKSKGYKYAGSNDIDLVAWYKDNSGGNMHPVGTKQPNELGLYDMTGNLEEWCEDVYSKYESYYTKNPKTTTNVVGKRYVLRGGCFRSNAMLCRISHRSSAFADDSYSYDSRERGFRVVLDKY